MILARIICAIFVFSSYVRGSELTDAVLQSKKLNEIEVKLKGTRFRAETAEQVPDLLLEAILTGRATDDEWKALDHYSRLVDAGAGLDFLRSCFKTLERDPLIFYRRFMSGDATALDRMRDALTYDFSAYDRQKPRTMRYREHREFYENTLKKIAANGDTLAGEALRRHEQFVTAAQRQFESWRGRYKDGSIWQ